MKVLKLSILIILLLFSNLRSEVFYIKPKAYLDVVSGKMIYQKIIGIENGIIQSIEAKAPANQNVQNLDNLFLLPGLIDCHTHLFFTQTLEDRSFENALMREIKNSDEMRLERARLFLKQYLSEGFTSVCDLGNSGRFLDVKLKNEIFLNFNFPDLYVSGPGIATFKGQFDKQTPDEFVNKEYLIITKETDVESIIQTYLNMKVDIIKVYLDNSPGQGTMNSKRLREIMQIANRHAIKKITFHAIEVKSFASLKDLPILSIEHGTNAILPKIQDEQKVFITLTDLSKDILEEFNYYNKVFYSNQLFRARKFGKTKIKLVFGPDFYFHKNNVGFNRALYVKKSITAWTSAGIAPLEIIRAMTINPASSLKEEGHLGVIKIGAKANLIGLSENPLLNLNALNSIKLLINKGKLIKRPL